MPVMTERPDERQETSGPESAPDPRTSADGTGPLSVTAWLLGAWLVAGGVAGLRLHRAGGVFGEAVPLGDSVVASLVNGTPWLVSAGVAWFAAGRWPLRRGEILPAMTAHAAVGLVTVASQLVALAALRTWVLPAELTPPDPWGQLPLDLIRWGPVALGVYVVLTGVMLAMRSAKAG